MYPRSLVPAWRNTRIRLLRSLIPVPH